MERSRRAVLAGLGAASAGSIAGCLDAGDSTTPIERDPETDGGEQTIPAGVDQFRGSLERWGYYPEATVPGAVDLDWREPEVNTSAYTAAKASPVPLPDGGVVVPGDTGDLTALAADGSVRWRAATDATVPGIHGTPVVADGHVFVGAYDGALYAFDADTGDRVWRTQLGGSIGSSPLYHDGVLYVAVEFPDPDGLLVAVDAASGEQLWAEPEHRPTHFPHSTPALSTRTGALVCGANDGYLYCWDYPELTFRWRFATDPPEDGEIKGPIATYDGAALFGSWDERIYRVDLATGTADWSFDTGGLSMTGPGIDPRLHAVFAGSHDGTLYALDASSGDEHWRFETDGRVTGCPTVCADRVLVGSTDGSLYAVEKRTGEEVWSFECGGAVTSTPRVVGDGIYVAERAPDPDGGATDGGLYRLVAAE